MPAALRADRVGAIGEPLCRFRATVAELYDMRRDPRQLRSRDGDPRYARTERALAKALASLRDCSGASCRTGLGAIPGPG